MFRRSNRWHSRFDQPDPYDGSYNLGDPQSFNRYTGKNKHRPRAQSAIDTEQIGRASSD
jgi:hypothetical protein